MPYKTKSLFDLDKTLAYELLENCEFGWEALPKIGDFIIETGKTLCADNFDCVDNNVWIAKTAKVAKSASITGPCIIDEFAEIRHCAFIRGNAIVGKGAVVGNSTELKNCILFDNVQVPHFNYIGDSILGYKSHLGAGAVTSNVKSDKSLISVKNRVATVETGLKKMGALVGDFVEVGCNSVLCPGTVLGRNSQVYPTSCVRGVLPENCILKNDGTIAQKY